MSVNKGKKAAKKRTRFKSALKWTLMAALILCTVFLLAGAVWVMGLYGMAELDVEKITSASQTLYIFDAEGEAVAGVHGIENRTNVSLRDVPLYVRNAFIAVEDVRFYSHKGVDFRRIIGALIADIKSGNFDQGGSTLTQQLIKLSHLTGEKTFTRKIQEAILAIQLEQKFTKDEILEMYLNYVYFGGGAYGIEAAAQRYFSKSASQLTLAEGALLAGVVKSPSNYAPHLKPEASVARRNLILDLMHQYGFISKETCEAAKAEKLELKETARDGYPHGYYIETAMDEARSILGIDQEQLLSGGYRVYTYLNAGLQQACEDIMADPSLFPENAADGEQVEGAIVTIDPSTFGVTALVGGREYKVRRGLNRATDIKRQPGSAIKPILVYAPALENYGYTAASLLLDEKTDFNGYSPKNYGDQYSGYVTLRQALARSLNVPAVRLLSNIGVYSGKSFASKLGIAFDEKDTSLSLALGGFTYGVSPRMICGAYAAFAAGGVYKMPSCVSKITDSEGNVLYERVGESQRVMSEDTAFIMTDMMTSCITTGTGRRLNIGIPLAGKTGTTGLKETNGNKDAWMVAYNREVVATVWMGFDSTDSAHSLPEDATGGTYPAAMLARLFEFLYPNGEGAPDFEPPKSINRVRLDAATLQTEHRLALANALTPAEDAFYEYFSGSTAPTDSTDYWVVPSPPGDLNAAAASDGRPVLSFSPVQKFILYRLYRTDSAGKTVLLGEFAGDRGDITFKDTTAEYGALYEYFVLPVHPELTVSGEEVTGPATARCDFFVDEPKNAQPVRQTDDEHLEDVEEQREQEAPEPQKTEDPVIWYAGE
ncbi:MAG: PBP1A family penicillin-binding protein [Christensenellales bacterium]